MEIDSHTSPSAPMAQSRSAGLQELKFDTDRLKIFYERIFPFQLFFKWLSYNQMKNRN